jgi:hypothetical protein
MIRAYIECFQVRAFLMTVLFAGSKSAKHRSFKQPTGQGEQKRNIYNSIFFIALRFYNKYLKIHQN